MHTEKLVQEVTDVTYVAIIVARRHFEVTL